MTAAIETGYHQLVTSSETARNPAEMAGAIGERSMRIRSIAPAMQSVVAANPNGMVRAIAVPMTAAAVGVIASMSGARAQSPAGRTKTSCASAPSSGKRT